MNRTLIALAAVSIALVITIGLIAERNISERMLEEYSRGLTDGALNTIGAAYERGVLSMDVVNGTIAIYSLPACAEQCRIWVEQGGEDSNG